MLHRPGARRHLDRHPAPFGKFDRIARQVEQNSAPRGSGRRLPTPARCRESGCAVSSPFSRARKRRISPLFRGHSRGRKAIRVDLELTRFDFREVRDVVQNRQERLGRNA